MAPLKRKETFWSSNLFLYSLALFGIPFSLFVYQSGIDGFVSQMAYKFWQIREWQDLFSYLSTMGSASTQIIICLIVAAYYYKKGALDWMRLWLYSIIVFLGTGLVSYLLKAIIGRPRPKMREEFFDPQWFEFSARLHTYPSGHTVTTFAWLACLLPFYPRLAGFLMFIAATIISSGRVGITSHFVSDVVFGAIVGYSVTTLWIRRKGLGTNNAPLDSIERLATKKFSSAWKFVLDLKWLPTQGKR